MKAWIVAIALIVVMGFTGFADAKGAGKKHDKGVKGIIGTVTGNSFTMTLKSKKGNAATITVKADNATITVSGQPGTIASLSAGQTVTVVGSRSGDTITATKITEGKKHKKKK